MFGFASLFLLGSAESYAKPLSLSVVLSEDAGAYLEYGNLLKDKLLNKNITFNVINAEQAIPESDLIVAVGMKAATTAMQYNPTALLAVLVSKEGYSKLLNDLPVQYKSAKSAYSAIYLDQPFKRQLSLISALILKQTPSACCIRHHLRKWVCFECRQLSENFI